tara:strand:+ start:1137 stop:1379 length:243 start_codon:yes stop_codon:yes gene_type:complete
MSRFWSSYEETGFYNLQYERPVTRMVSIGEGFVILNLVSGPPPAERTLSRGPGPKASEAKQVQDDEVVTALYGTNPSLLC